MGFKKIEKLSLDKTQEAFERWIFECEAGHRVAMQNRIAEKGKCPLCKIGLRKGENDFPTLYPQIAGDLVRSPIPTFEVKHPSNILPTQAYFLKFRCPECRKIYRGKVKDEVKRHACPNCGLIPTVTLKGSDIFKALTLLPESSSSQIQFFDTGTALMAGVEGFFQDVYVLLRTRRTLGEKKAIVIDRQKLFQLSTYRESIHVCPWNGRIYAGSKTYEAKIEQVPQYPSFALIKNRGYRPPNITPESFMLWANLAKAVNAESIGVGADKDGNAILAALIDERPVAVGRFKKRV